MKTKLFLASALLFAAGVTTIFAATPESAPAHWVGNSAVKMNDTWYYCGTGLSWCTGGAFNNAVLEQAVLNLGGQSQIYNRPEGQSENTDYNWSFGTPMEMKYRIDDGEENTVTLKLHKWNVNDYGEANKGNNMLFDSNDDAVIDLTEYWDGQDHYLYVWFTSGTVSDPQNGNYYKATIRKPTADWIGNSAINVNGSWYYCGSYLDWCTGAFNDLGEISSLILGGQSQVGDNGKDWTVGTVTMYYKIDNGEANTISLSYDSYGYGEYSNNMRFQSGGQNFEGIGINISGFEAGSTHTIAVWFNCDNQWDNNYNQQTNEGDNYVATFTKKAPTAIAKSNDITVSDDAVDVQINGLTLYKDTYWTSICLPFSLSQVEIETSPLAGAVICTLSSATFENGTLSLVFANQTAITAGTPYLVKWTESGTNIVDPIFTGVKLSTKTEGEVQCGNATFKGTFDLISFEAENQDVLFLGGENTLYYPESGASIGAFHSYFELNIPEPEANPIKAFVLNFDDETTSIQEISNTTNTSNAIYTLDGRRINGQPATAGLYIINGKKVVIK